MGSGGGMKRLALVGVAGLIVASAAVSAAGAAPDNKNTGGLSGTCNGQPFDITFIEHDSSVRAFFPGGVGVAKQFSGVFDITFTVGGQTVLQFQDVFSQDVGIQGKGLAGRLAECTFPEEFVDPPFILTEEIAAELFDAFGVDLSAYIGEEVVVSGVGVLTVKALLPGA